MEKSGFKQWSTRKKIVMAFLWLWVGSILVHLFWGSPKEEKGQFEESSQHVNESSSVKEPVEFTLVNGGHEENQVSDIAQVEIKQFSEKIKSGVNEFCYAKAAASICDDLSIVQGTEDKFYESIGIKSTDVIGLSAPLNSVCMAGLDQAYSDDSKKTLCTTAWKKYGCNGEVIGGLVQQNGLHVVNPIRCEFLE